MVTCSIRARPLLGSHECPVRNRSSSAGRTSSAAGPSGAPAVDAPHDRGGDARGLAHHQPARRRDLVGEGDDRRLEGRAVLVRPSAQVEHRGEPRASDRHVHHSLPPCAAERIGDHHSDGDAQSTAEPLRIPRPTASGSRGRSENPGSTFDASTPALAQTSPWGVSAITRSPRRATTRRPPAPHAVRSRPRPEQSALGLRHDLLSDHYDVACWRPAPRAAAREARRLRRRDGLSEALEADDLDAHASPHPGRGPRGPRAPPFASSP